MSSCIASVVSIRPGRSVCICVFLPHRTSVGGRRLCLLVYCISEPVLSELLHTASYPIYPMNWIAQQFYFVFIVLFYSFSFHCNLYLYIFQKPSWLSLQRCCISPSPISPWCKLVCFVEQTERHELIKAVDFSK